MRHTSVLITGAAGGIGAAIARQALALRASRLILIDADMPGLEALADEFDPTGVETTCLQCDLSNASDVEDTYTSAATVGYDYCFNNAGMVAGPPDFPDFDPQWIARLIAVNLTAVVLGTGYAIRHLKQRGGGAIVNTGSTSALKPAPADAPYRASKAGVLFLTECCRSLAETTKVRVNSIVPGVTDTPILNDLAEGAVAPGWLGAITRDIRIWTPDEIARKAIELAQDTTSFGQNLVLFNESRDHSGSATNI